jgi:hypothetical protein
MPRKNTKRVRPIYRSEAVAPLQYIAIKDSGEDIIYKGANPK